MVFIIYFCYCVRQLLAFKATTVINF
uniref:Uncharacterized protein n=1 Tax=Rhizophora mucronata TaxID=61149 RepID=A0A2P2PMJ9_RHIMU